MDKEMFNPMEIDAIGEMMNISLGSSATAVSNMLDHRVDITTPKVSVVDVKDFTIGKLEPAMGVEIKYVEGLEGSNIMLLRKSDIKVIVDILMGSETPDEEFELNELTISAVCEVMNQMMGAAATALSDFLGYPVNISTPTPFELKDLDEFKKNHLPQGADQVVVVRFSLKIENALESEFMNVMSVSLAKELLRGLGLGDEDEEEAPPAPAPEPVPASAGLPAREPGEDCPLNAAEYRLLALLPGLLSRVPAANRFAQVFLSLLLPLLFLIALSEDWSTSTEQQTAPAKGRSALAWAATAVPCLVLIAFFAGWLPAYPTAIATGSMEPEIQIGDMVVMARWGLGDIQPGDVIAVERQGRTIVHRVVEVRQDAGETRYITQGDANNAPDEEPAAQSQVEGRMIGSVPALGRISLWFHTDG